MGNATNVLQNLPQYITVDAAVLIPIICCILYCCCKKKSGTWPFFGACLCYIRFLHQRFTLQMFPFSRCWLDDHRQHQRGRCLCYPRSRKTSSFSISTQVDKILIWILNATLPVQLSPPSLLSSFSSFSFSPFVWSWPWRKKVPESFWGTICLYLFLTAPIIWHNSKRFAPISCTVFRQGWSLYWFNVVLFIIGAAWKQDFVKQTKISETNNSIPVPS